MSPAIAASGLPLLHLEVPGAPRVETQQYRFPPAAPMAPPAADCSDEQLLELAAGACRNATELWALLGSGEHVRRICELLGARDKRAIGQQVELEEARTRLGAAQRMVTTARSHVAAVRRTLAAEIDAHCATARQADQEHELRCAAVAELDRIAQLHERDSAELARVSAHLYRVSYENIHLRHQLQGTTPAEVQVALERAARGAGVLAAGSGPDVTAHLNDQPRRYPTVDGRIDDSDEETEIVDLPLPGGAS